MKPQTTAERLFEQAFPPSRPPRSPAYKRGVIYALRVKFENHREPYPYPLGTAEADAYFAGTQEGHRIAAVFRDNAIGGAA